MCQYDKLDNFFISYFSLNVINDDDKIQGLKLGFILRWLNLTGSISVYTYILAIRSPRCHKSWTDTWLELYWLPMSQNHILDFAKSKSVSTCLCCFTTHYSSTQLSGFIGTQPKLFLTKCSRYWILSHTNLGQQFRLFENEIWFNQGSGFIGTQPKLFPTKCSIYTVSFTRKHTLWLVLYGKSKPGILSSHLNSLLLVVVNKSH